MKIPATAKFHKRMTEHDKLYGTTTIGARGQVVIPAEARKDLGLKPGTRLIVIGKFGKLLGLLKADELEDFIKVLMSNFEGMGIEKDIKEHLSKFMGKASKAHVKN